uniref:Uncharacterized protein n=1 Tax=Junco hyemalis TaxID=40217 RepID=A0A8C5ISE6_JUNHY
MWGWGRGGCWGSRSGGCVTWTGPGSAACPTTPSPAWTAWPGPLPPDTTSGTPGTTAGPTAPSAAPSSRPLGSASMSWCMAAYVWGWGLVGSWGAWGPWPTRALFPQAGKFGIVPTLINTVAAFTSIGVGTVLCDIILLNFLKGAEHYKARKFEEVRHGAGVPWGWGHLWGSTSPPAAVTHPVPLSPAPQVSEAGVPATPSACPPGALGTCSRDKQSTDSGTFSLGL